MIPEARGNRELGPSHRLLYREFEPEDGGLPYREIVAFEPRKNDRPFEVAAARLGRTHGTRIQTLAAAAVTSGAAPIRQPLPPDLRLALAAAANVAEARGAVTTRPTTHRGAGNPRRGDPPSRER